MGNSLHNKIYLKRRGWGVQAACAWIARLLRR